MSDEQPTENSDGGVIAAALPPIPIPPVYYEAKSNRYFFPDSRGVWTGYGKEEARQYLYEKGRISTRCAKGAEFSPADLELGRIRSEKSVVYAGPVGGVAAGPKVTGSSRYLVTAGPELTEPKAGKWDTIETLGTRLFGEKQFEYVLGWCSTATKYLYQGNKQRAQLLAMAGPPSCGKSFWQHRVITPILGGRTARPLQFMTGKTSFNEDIIKAEHLIMEDESAKIDTPARQELGAQIKNYTVNVTQRVHGKGKDAFVVASCHWMSMSLNDEVSSLAILPIMDDSILDKVILTACQSAINKQWPGEGKSEWLEQQIEAEIPAFIYYLLHVHVIREELRDMRFGIKYYHDPKLMERLDGLAPESELAELIDKLHEKLSKEGGEITISQGDLRGMLVSDPGLGYRAKSILYYSSSCGVLLEKLAKRDPKKYIAPPAHQRHKVWTIRWGKHTPGGGS